jgi:hypothetical protein
MQAQTDTFTWRNVCYDIEIKGEPRWLGAFNIGPRPIAFAESSRLMTATEDQPIATLTSGETLAF